MSVAAVLADSADWGHMGGWGGGWGGGWMWLTGVATMLVFTVAIVWVMRAAGSNAGPVGNPQREPVDRAREILAERYASGELSTTEYQERVSQLQ